MDETTYTITWVSAGDIQPEHREFPIRQVYTWANTSDNKIVIVSKDGTKWQLPGGKPDSGEAMIATALRELYEETGIDAYDIAEQLKFFGYNVVREVAGSQQTTYLQVRFALALPLTSEVLPSVPPAEDTQQDVSEQIQFVHYITPAELVERIKWMKHSEETAAALAAIGN